MVSSRPALLVVEPARSGQADLSPVFEGEGSSLVRSGQFPHLRCDTDFGGLAVDCAVVVVVVVFVFSPRIPQWQSAGLVIGRSRVRSPAGAARFFFFVFFFLLFSSPSLTSELY